MTTDVDDLATVADAAKESGLTQNTIRTHIRDRSLDAEKIGRDWFIRKSDLAAFIVRWGRKPLEEKK